jgi:hypothetical protein
MRLVDTGNHQIVPRTGKRRNNEIKRSCELRLRVLIVPGLSIFNLRFFARILSEFITSLEDLYYRVPDLSRGNI